ncbi:MAG TPA: DUF4142 domain-containing protein [Gammaproteobacteria bacterium]|nr:DUF4142 domain-containing protein [Gammaproteobacteria bacterium]
MISRLYVPFAIAFAAVAAAPALAQQPEPQQSQKSERAQQRSEHAQERAEQRDREHSERVAAAGGQKATQTQDEQFLKTAIQDNIAEIKLGQLAMERGQSQQIKDLGKAMAQDHTKGLADALQIAVAMNMVAPTEPPQSAAQQYEKLKALSGENFDKQFASTAVMAHEKAVDLFMQQEQSAQSTQVQQYARNTLPVLKKHLEMAQAAQKGSGDKLGANLPGRSHE